MPTTHHKPTRTMDERRASGPALARAPKPGHPRGGESRGGFTLLEAAMATIIIGVGVLAVVEAQQSFMQRNAYSSGSATATYLASELREMTRSFSRHDRFSGGIYFVDPADPGSFQGWGIELGETTVPDLDDLDDLDGAVFGDATEFPDGFTLTARYDGPVNAFGEAIPETLFDGSTEMFVPPGEEDAVAVAMRGWTQIVSVEKVEPGDITDTVADTYDLRDGATILRAVNRFPVRVTVTVLKQDDAEDEPEVMTVLSWVVMP